jgi:hypothetical protein
MPAFVSQIIEIHCFSLICVVEKQSFFTPSCMKKVSIGLFILLLISQTAFRHPDVMLSTKPIGVWRLVSAQWRKMPEGWQYGKDYPAGPSGLQCIKMVSRTRYDFAFFETKSKQFVGAGGGIYNLIGDQFLFTPQYFSMDTSKVGKLYAFDSKVEGSKWQLDGASSLEIAEKTGTAKAGTPVVKTKVEGVWKMFSATYSKENKTYLQDSSSYVAVKTIFGNRFSYSYFDSKKKELIRTGGGTFTINGNKFIETLDYAFPESKQVGKPVTYTLDLEGKRWTYKNSDYTEVWDRVE